MQYVFACGIKDLRVQYRNRAAVFQQQAAAVRRGFQKPCFKARARQPERRGVGPRFGVENQ